MIVLMENVIVYIVLALLGISGGSFIGASLWRIRAYQLLDDKNSGEKYSKTEYDKLHKLMHKSMLNDRSICLSCSYRLKWFDMIPVLSWLQLGGRCRKCRAPIGITEILLEVGVALFFVLSFAFWPYQITDALEVVRFVTWIIAGLALALLFVYDLKWFILPNKVSFGLMAVAAIGALVTVLLSIEPVSTLYSIIGSAVILSGLYYMLYAISKGRWVGFGDVKLGIGLALLLADWQLAFIALFAANLVGSLIVVPLMMTGKLKRDSHVPLGPLLILGTIIAKLAGFSIIDWYINTLV